MKRVLVVIILVVAAAAVGLWRSHGGVRAGLSRAVSVSGDDSPSVTGDETRKTFDLKPGARLEVSGIKGSGQIQTSDTTTDEVFVKRTPQSPHPLGRREMII